LQLYLTRADGDPAVIQQLSCKFNASLQELAGNQGRPSLLVLGGIKPLWVSLTFFSVTFLFPFTFLLSPIKKI